MSKKTVSNSNKTLILIICIGVFLGFFIKLFCFDLLHVSGTSMETTIKNGSTIAVNKLAYGFIKPYSDELLFKWKNPQKNDIVIYIYNNKFVVKRCVATENTLLEYNSKDGYNLIVEGKIIPLNEEQFLNLKSSSKVPEGYILAIGDNYLESVDSRDYGFVNVNNILGKVLCK